MYTKKRIRDTETKYGNLRAAALTHQKFTAAVRNCDGTFEGQRGSFFLAGSRCFLSRREIFGKGSALVKMRYNHVVTSVIIEVTDADRFGTHSRSLGRL